MCLDALEILYFFKRKTKCVNFKCIGPLHSHFAHPVARFTSIKEPLALGKTLAFSNILYLVIQYDTDTFHNDLDPFDDVMHVKEQQNAHSGQQLLKQHCVAFQV